MLNTALSLVCQGLDAVSKIAATQPDQSVAYMSNKAKIIDNKISRGFDEIHNLNRSLLAKRLLLLSITTANIALPH